MDITPADLPRLADRQPSIYLEHCVISQKDNALIATDEHGETAIPIATISTLMLGPGCSISHNAVSLATEMGATLLWVGEQGVRCYAAGSALNDTTRLLSIQARLVSNERTRLMVARVMYSRRFPNENISEYTMHQLLGREGKRIAAVYDKEAQKYHIRWSGRNYDWNSSHDPHLSINRALSSANAALYGMAHAAISALGCSTALGFVHCGHQNSFVFDVADLYKTETSIPLAFSLHACPPKEVGGIARRMMRDRITSERLMEKCIADIRSILEDADSTAFPNQSSIWNGGKRYKETGHDYSKS